MMDPGFFSFLISPPAIGTDGFSHSFEHSFLLLCICSKDKILFHNFILL